MFGVISFQGDFQKHVEALRSLGESVRSVRSPEDLTGLTGVIIPGGESTTIGKLMQRFGLLEGLRRAIDGNLAVMGTCAGAILLAERIEESTQERIGGLDMAVRRNAYGRQIDSFEARLQIPALGEAPFEGVFIRAPRITAVGEDMEVLSTYEGSPVFVRRRRLLALTFHPELTGDNRIHRFFVDIARDRR